MNTSRSQNRGWLTVSLAVAALGAANGGSLVGVARADTIAWDGDGANRLWNTATNWSTDTVPTAADDVLIVMTGTYTVTLDVDAALASLTLGGESGTQTLSMTGRTLTLNGPSAVGANGALVLHNGSAIAGSGGLANSGSLLASGVVNAINGAFSNTKTGTLQVNWVGEGFGTGILTIANGFTNAGQILLTSDWRNSSSQLTVTNGTLTNIDTIRAVVSPSGEGGGERIIAAQVVNTGTIDVESPLSINSGGILFDTTTGTLDIAAGNALTVNAPETQMGTGTSFLGTGSILFAGTHVLTLVSDVVHPASGTGVQFDLSGAVTIAGPGQLTNLGNLVLSFNDTINTACTNSGLLLAHANGNSNFINGAFFNMATGTLQVNWVGGGFGTGILTIANGFTNAGQILLTSEWRNSSSQLTVTNGTLTNTGTIRALVSGSGTGGDRILAAQVVHNGIIQVESPLTINSGALHLVPGSSCTGSAALIVEGATLDGAGDVAVSVVARNGASIAPGDPVDPAVTAELNFGSNLTLQTPVNVNINIGGLSAGSQHDRLNVTGSLSIAGSLNLALAGNFVPDPATFYTIITYGSRTGTFSPINGLPICDELSFSPFYGSSAFDLLVSGVQTQECLCSHGVVQVTTTSLPPAVLGTTYSALLGVDCGVSPYSWSLASGGLPEGFSLAADGTLSGTSNQAGDFIFTVEVTDSEGQSVQKLLDVTVAASAPPVTLDVDKWGPTPVPGRTLHYFILVRNIGNVTSSNTQQVAEFVDPWFALVSTVPPADDISDDRLILWDLGVLDPGEYALFEYSVILDRRFPFGATVSGCACLTEQEHQGCRSIWRDLSELAWQQCQNVDPYSARVACYNASLQSNIGIYNDCLTYLGGTPNPECDCSTNPVQGPVDPNEKGVLTQQFIRPDETLYYPIHFENIGTIEALDVFLTDVLDPNLDEATIQFITTPAGTFEQGSRTLRWDLLGINLPPGETGSVLFSVKPLAGLPSGTQIRNDATIQFEVFDPITTNEVVNIIDDSAPECVMNTLPAVSQPWFEVSWSGTDAVGEIESYSILVSVDGGPFAVHSTTPDLSMGFDGEQNHSYEFLCIARDTAGNIEVQAASAEAFTTTNDAQDLTAPNLTINPVTSPTCVAGQLITGTASDPIIDGISSSVASVEVNALPAFLDDTGHYLGFAPLVPGPNDITVMARDYAGNETLQMVQVFVDEPDTDTDGVCDAGDNCPATSNGLQEDADADGLGNACDPCPQPVTFVPQPSNVQVASGGDAAFTAPAGGNGAVSYQWQRDGQDLTDGPAPGGGTISGSTTDTLTLTGVQLDDAGEYAVAVTDACTSGVSDAATLTVNVPAAAIAAAVSRKSCDLAVTRVNGAGARFSEPRQGGITELRLTFDVAPGGPGANPITLEQATCAAPAFVPYSGASTRSASVVGNELVLTFSPGLEIARTYRVSMNPVITSAAGQSVEASGLVGDVNSDGLTNSADRSVVVGIWTGSGFSCATDINSSGQTNAADRSAVVGAWTSPTANCAP